MIEVELTRIMISETRDSQVIFLREKEGERTFQIAIGFYEAFAIDRYVKGKDAPRPLTHDLLASVVDALNAKVDHIVVNQLKDQTFYAKLVLRHGDGVVEVDARPSDSIALATKVRAPIYVEEDVMDQVAQAPPE
jgi:bifunctional DNase/RNase